MGAGAGKRSGLLKGLLRGAPQYSLSPLHRLGALIAIVFLVEAATGLLMLPYYRATPGEAYATTQRIMRRLPYGALISTVHTYAAYAMVLLAFTHLMRGYFVSAYRRPRGLMWVVGILLGCVVLGFGFTGFLLTWTQPSWAVADASLIVLRSLPGGGLCPAAGRGVDAALLSSFFHAHTLVLPGLFLALLGLKLFLRLRLGPSEPVSRYPREGSDRSIPWFPGVATYLLEISAALIAAILAVSAMLPLTLPEEHSATAPLDHSPGPQWYLLWIYHLLRPFRDIGLLAPVTAVAAVGLVITLLPLIDRSETRNPRERPVHTALGLLLIIEVGILTFWKYIAQGSASVGALLILGAPVLATALWLSRRRKA